MLVSESKNKDAVVRIYDDYFENESEQILDKLSEIVSGNIVFGNYLVLFIKERF